MSEVYYYSGDRDYVEIDYVEIDYAALHWCIDW